MPGAFGLGSLKRSLLYSEELGIDLEKGGDDELFKWFLASILFGARISQGTAKKTYRAFERHKLLNPQAILEAGKDYLVSTIMREGGYVRYDGRKSTQILRDCEHLLDRYGGSLTRLHEEAKDDRDLEDRLKEFYGVGPVTMNILLRELRPFWDKSDPAPMPIVVELAANAGIDLDIIPRKSREYARIEAGLLRGKKKAGN